MFIHFNNKSSVGYSIKFDLHLLFQAMSGFAENDPLAKVFIYNKLQGKTHATIKKEGAGQAIEFCCVLSKERRQGRSPR